MTKVITYGTYDLLHYGHIRLLERAKALGDYLIVGITSDDFDKNRGKINVQQSLMERVDAVKATGIADKIIIEEYEGQKIDDIQKYDVDIFTVGSDWKGKFDYLNEFCKVIYLERTEGISSSDLRNERRKVNFGLVGDSSFLNKIYRESKLVNGLKVNSVFSKNIEILSEDLQHKIVGSYEALLSNVNAVYIRSLPCYHYNQIKLALNNGVNVLCESPLTLSKDQTRELFLLAQRKKLILMEAIKTAYSTAFSRMLLLTKEGKIGKVVSVDATCTSLRKGVSDWDGVSEWGPTALLPILEILGNTPESVNNNSCTDSNGRIIFSKIDFIYKDSVATAKFGDGVKSEGELIVSGTKGYVYIPAPWWNTEYFELRFEEQNENKRYFYSLEGEGIRNELVAFARSIEKSLQYTENQSDPTAKKRIFHGNIREDITKNTTEKISEIIGNSLR